MKTSKGKGILRLILLEFLALNLSLLAVYFISHISTISKPENEIFFRSYIPLVLLFNFCWALILFLTGDSDNYLYTSFRKRIKFLVLNSFVLVGVIFLVCLYLQVDYFIQRILLLSIVLFNLFNVLFFKLLYQFYSRNKEKTENSKVLIVGGNRTWKQLPDFTETVEHYGYQVIGMLNGKHRAPTTSPFTVSGPVADLSNVLAANPVDEIFITLSSLKEREIKDAIETADYYGVRVNLVPETPNFLSVNLKPAQFEDLPIFKLRQSPLDGFRNYVVKSTFDFCFALAVILGLLPIYLIISILIYMEDRGPIFYTPIRKGEKGTTFKCYKFRTMSVCDDPVNGQKSTEVNDPRITRVGKFMRKYDIDELPQFFNVLLGDMSVVGPRPHRTFLQNDFREIVNEYMVRHYVKPGITGWAQVNGWRGPTKTVEQKKERVKHDLWYIENWSLWLDLKIVFLTVFGKKTRQNAF